MNMNLRGQYNTGWISVGHQRYLCGSGLRVDLTEYGTRVEGVRV